MPLNRISIVEMLELEGPVRTCVEAVETLRGMYVRMV